MNSVLKELHDASKLISDGDPVQGLFTAVV